MLLQASLKSQMPGYCRAKGRHPERPAARYHRISGSFGRKPRSYVIVGRKCDIVRKTVLILKTPTRENANSALFLFGFFIQSILNKIEISRTHLPNL